ncbi:MAG: 1,4-dihydroxy-2-naphthoate octaprenyltransferase [Muribaculum sp.]|nr:1,4-dihydroxy-2-naphthoate octaprenyltransferase [Muribaculum sp.]
MKKFKIWLEAARPKTLPVSVAGVVAASACAVADGCFHLERAVLCLFFAVLAQIASNFANEYYDFRAGLDRRGREGPRRGVTEGDISPQAMLVATYVTLACASAVGLSLLVWGGWWLLAVGMFVVAGALAYSTGPYPLSHHGLGEVTVILFFGIIPVCCTYAIMAGDVTQMVATISVAIGIAGANVLVVNNFRDIDDDRAVGKHTLAVIIGRRATLYLYAANWIIVALLLVAADATCAPIATVVMLTGLCVWNYMRTHTGRALNPALGLTALITLLMALAMFLIPVLR